VQAGAVRELAGMRKQEPLRDATLQLLVAWQQSLPPAAQQSEDERELTMNLDRVYERWERKVKAQGRREGKAEGKAEGNVEGRLEIVLKLLAARYGALSTAVVARVRETSAADLERIAERVLTAETLDEALSAR